jgi:hypothetical protein
MTLAMNALGRLLLRCCVAAAMLHAAAPASANVPPTMTLPKPGDTREWLADRYALEAEFELQRGKVVVWRPADDAAPGPLVEFAGALDEESTRVLDELLRKGRMHTLSIAGPGGMVVPTLKLGRALRAKGVTTAVEVGRGCYSACALLFLAGETRIYNNSAGITRSAAEVGFHAPYTVGPDGQARHLQDVKGSITCAYIKQMVPAQSAAELCDYTLATKGMATFSLEAGKKLSIYTSSESEVLTRLAEALADSPTLEEREWIACERIRLYRPAWSTSKDELDVLSPCTPQLAPQAPSPHARLVALTKAARALGPNEKLMTRAMRERAQQAAADRLLAAGLTDGEQHYVACFRAELWIKREKRQPNQDATWAKPCWVAISLVEEPRKVEGVGTLRRHHMMMLLERVAEKQGPDWPPPTKPKGFINGL